MRELSDIPSKQAFSQVALPVMRPESSRMRVTTVALIVGVQSSAAVPLVQVIVARAILSFSAIVRPTSSLDVGVVDFTVTFDAPASFVHVGGDVVIRPWI